MNDSTVQEYLGTLYEKYNGKKDNNVCGILNELREKFADDVRDAALTFSNSEIHDLHMCISECISYHEKDKSHITIDGKCPYCESYKVLWNRIVRKCDCVDNPDLE